MSPYTLKGSKLTDTPSTVAPFVLAVVGPTGVGKTAVAEEVALRRNGEIVSADSMQIYTGMDIGTAKQPVAERRVPYHCVDLVEPGVLFSAALFQAASRAAFADIASRGRLPVLCGGTGLYVRAALDDLHFPAGEQAGNEARERWEAYAAKNGPEALYARLVELDPGSAALVHPNNTRRAIRALEMIENGDSYAEQRAGFHLRRSAYPCAMVGLDMEREALYERTDARVDAMMDAGLLGEVESLLEKGMRPALTAHQAIGYKELVPVIEKGAPVEEAVVVIKQASRRYAKRQLTWFRADPRVKWVDVTELSTAQAADAVLAMVDSGSPTTR